MEAANILGGVGKRTMIVICLFTAMSSPLIISYCIDGCRWEHSNSRKNVTLLLTLVIIVDSLNFLFCPNTLFRLEAIGENYQQHVNVRRFLCL